MKEVLKLAALPVLLIGSALFLLSCDYRQLAKLSVEPETADLAGVAEGETPTLADTDRMRARIHRTVEEFALEQTAEREAFFSRAQFAVADLDRAEGEARSQLEAFFESVFAGMVAADGIAEADPTGATRTVAAVLGTNSVLAAALGAFGIRPANKRRRDAEAERDEAKADADAVKREHAERMADAKVELERAAAKHADALRRKGEESFNAAEQRGDARLATALAQVAAVAPAAMAPGTVVKG